MSYDARGIAAVAAVSDVAIPHTVLHYLYAPTSEAAAIVAEELKCQGFRTEERISAYRENWLVLASHEVVLSEQLIASLRHSMETLVNKVGGEYDGWEVEVRCDDGPSQSLH